MKKEKKKKKKEKKAKLEEEEEEVKPEPEETAEEVSEPAGAFGFRVSAIEELSRVRFSSGTNKVQKEKEETKGGVGVMSFCSSPPPPS